MINNATWIISDTHFGHDKIIEFCDRPKRHELLMMANWIDRVKDTDTIIHLGDISMWKSRGIARKWLKVISRLPGQKHLILGNHDPLPRDEYEAVFRLVTRSWYIASMGLILTHEPYSEEMQKEYCTPGPVTTNVHGHIHNNDHRAEEWTPIPGVRYINASVEVTEYAPVQLGNLLGRSGWHG